MIIGYAFMNFDEGFSRRVAMARNSLGLTQAELADKVGVVTRQIAAYEGNEAKPRAKVLSNLAAALGTTMQWLMTGEGKSPDISKIKQTITVTEIPVISLADAYQYFYSSDNSGLNCISGMIPSPLLTSESAFAIEVKGDAMTSHQGVSFIEGSIVTFDPNIEAKHCDLVLVNEEGSDSIFFVQALRDNHSWSFRYLNPIYQSPISNSSKASILAVAIHYQLDLRDGDHLHWFYTPSIPKIAAELSPGYIKAEGSGIDISLLDKMALEIKEIKEILANKNIIKK
ncbi:helix-turn-helix domain-containing protein [Morganella morganii]